MTWSNIQHDYQLMDNYTLFYFKFVEPNHGVAKSHWAKMLGTSALNAWAGLAFERLCLQHVDQIQETLRIGGVHANIHVWRSPHAQIDLLQRTSSPKWPSTTSFVLE